MKDTIAKIVAAPIKFAFWSVGAARRDPATFLVVVVIGTFFALFVWATVEDEVRQRAAEAEWMAECEADRKHYECVAMWRGAQPPERRESDLATGIAIGTSVGMGMSSGRR